MIHYMYLLTFNDGMLYVGARSTNLDTAELDACYLGSGKALPARTRNTCTKTILNTYESRRELLEAEKAYIQDHSCVDSENYYNLRVSTHDRHGCEGVDTNTGRNADTHSYIARANEKRKQYVGDNRTPAQKHSDAKLRGVSTGPNPLKGLKGSKSPHFQPWYYITPKGEYHEEHHRTRDIVAKELGFTTRQFDNRMRGDNEHVPGKRGPIKGWILGRIKRDTA